MKTSIVLGLMFGDEGKGLVTSCLSDESTLVIRFCGGHQAGHTVEKDGYRHVFSQFGSGTLNGAATYWSEYCTFEPQAYINELKALQKHKYFPNHYIHPLCPIVTPYDILANRNSNNNIAHGTVGVGFGTTIKRHEESPYKLYAIDLTNRQVFLHKLTQIRDYYGFDTEISSYISTISNLNLRLRTLSEIYWKFDNLVFEGAQGIMLDKDFGFFPNVTRADTTSKQAFELIEKYKIPINSPDIYYVMRPYQTRHGNGPMSHEQESFSFKDETNISSGYQGKFRQGWHSKELIKYALSCDEIYSSGNKHIVVTCLNQTNGKIMIDREDKGLDCLSEFKYPVTVSYSPTELGARSVLP